MRFAAHVHPALVGEDLVLLDARAGRYLCLPGARGPLGLTGNALALSPADARVAAGLLAADLATRDDAPGSRSPPPARPTREPPHNVEGRLTLGEAFRLMASLWDVLRHYRGRDLPEILAYAGRNAAGAGPGDLDRAAETHRLVRRFEAAAIWLPVPDKCLARCFLLLRFLQRSGLGARWVFGVRTWPFMAHCWLQLGDTALGDDPERLSAYTPILAV